MQDSLIKLTDVTLRDGLQSEPTALDTAQKLALFESLLQCSYHRLEITSFSHPKWIPQLSDSEAFCRSVFKNQLSQTTELMAFVPNEKGMERFLNYPLKWASVFTAASETFHQRNINVSISEGMGNLKNLISKLRAEKRSIRVYISTVFGCPYEKDIPMKTLEERIKQVVDLVPDEIALSDTIGVASPKRVQKVLELILPLFPKDKIALHFHNTYGMALANVQVALEMGITQFDGSTGGIGGCPYAKGATGNVATEELAYLFHRQKNGTSVSWTGIEKTLRLLSQNRLCLQSHLASVLLKGGEWYGIS